MTTQKEMQNCDFLGHENGITLFACREHEGKENNRKIKRRSWGKKKRTKKTKRHKEKKTCNASHVDVSWESSVFRNQRGLCHSAFSFPLLHFLGSQTEKITHKKDTQIDQSYQKSPENWRRSRTEEHHRQRESTNSEPKNPISRFASAPTFLRASSPTQSLHL